MQNRARRALRGGRRYRPNGKEMQELLKQKMVQLQKEQNIISKTATEAKKLSKGACKRSTATAAEVKKLAGRIQACSAEVEEAKQQAYVACQEAKLCQTTSRIASEMTASLQDRVDHLEARESQTAASCGDQNTPQKITRPSNRMQNIQRPGTGNGKGGSGSWLDFEVK